MKRTKYKWRAGTLRRFEHVLFSELRFWLPAFWSIFGVIKEDDVFVLATGNLNEGTRLWKRESQTCREKRHASWAGHALSSHATLPVLNRGLRLRATCESRRNWHRGRIAPSHLAFVYPFTSYEILWSGKVQWISFSKPQDGRVWIEAIIYY